MAEKTKTFLKLNSKPSFTWKRSVPFSGSEQLVINVNTRREELISEENLYRFPPLGTTIFPKLGGRAFAKLLCGRKLRKINSFVAPRFTSCPNPNDESSRTLMWYILFLQKVTDLAKMGHLELFDDVKY